MVLVVSVGARLVNSNGLATLEYINTPGQFFVIYDIDGSVFGLGDRQSFGLVAEDIYDGTNLRGGVAPFSGGAGIGRHCTLHTGSYPTLGLFTLLTTKHLVALVLVPLARCLANLAAEMVGTCNQSRCW